MTTAAKTTFGNKLFLAPASGGTLTSVAELLSFDPPASARGTIDVTTHDSAGGAEEVIVEGTYDPGEIKGQVHYIGGSAADLAMITAMTSGALQNFKIQMKSAAGTIDRTGSAYLTNYGPDGQSVKGKQTAAFTLKVTGGVTQAATV